MSHIVQLPCSCGKRGYRSEHDAQKALYGIQGKVRNMRKTRTPVILRQERRIYECDWSGFWHLTSRRSFDR